MSTLFWSTLEDDDLELVIRSNDYKRILAKINKDDEQYKAWEAEAELKFKKQFSLTNHTLPSLFSAINDAPSFTVMTLASILGVTTLSVVTLGIFTALTAAALVVSGIIFFIKAYREREATNRDNFKIFIYQEAVISACAERNRRGKMSPLELKPTATPDTHRCDQFKYKTGDKLNMIGEAVGGGILTFSVLMGTYYLCIAVVALGFGVAAASTILLGPIGLGIALGVAAILGGIYAYYAYQQSNTENKVRKLTKFLEREIDKEDTEHFKQQGQEVQPRHHNSTANLSHSHDNKARMLTPRRRPTGGVGSKFFSPRPANGGSNKVSGHRRNPTL